MRTLLRIASFLVVGLALSGTARGDDDAAALQKAKALYEEATPLLDAKKYAEACPKLREAARLVPIAVGARLALGECEEGLGHLATALAAYRKAAVLAGPAGQPEREQTAKARAAALEGKVGTLALVLRPGDATAAGLTIELDGRRLEPAEVSAPFPIDAGKHTLVATTADGRRFETARETKDGERASVNVELSAAAAPPSTATATASTTAPATAAPTATAATTAGPSATPPSSPLRTIGLVGAIAGVAALGVGGGMGGLALSKNEESYKDDNCVKGGACNATGAAARRAAYDAATISTALFIGGGVLTAAGAAVFLFAPKPVTTGRAGQSVTVGVGPTGLLVRGKF